MGRARSPTDGRPARRTSCSRWPGGASSSPCLPDPSAEEFTLTPTGRERSASAAEDAYEQAVRQRWRALALVIKAKLEAVEAGISTVEDEFLAHVALPAGGTVGEWMRPRLDEVYASGRMPALLPGGSDG
jgi:hypothetical protein